MPNIDWATLRATIKIDERLAVEAQTQTLHHDVRAAGKAFRHYNELVGTGESLTLANARQNVLDEVRRAIAHGVDGLLMLRAYQTQRFLEEIHAWEQSGEASPELIALAGDFTQTVDRNDWCRAGGGPRALAMSDELLRIMYKRRWNDIMGLSDVPEITLTIDENRLRHTFLIRHPFRRKIDVLKGNPLTIRMVERRRLASIDRLAALDESYPAMLARGVVHYQSGSYARAASAFRSYLTAEEHPRYALRARNYLKAALDKSEETGGI